MELSGGEKEGMETLLKKLNELHVVRVQDLLKELKEERERRKELESEIVALKSMQESLRQTGRNRYVKEPEKSAN